MDLDFTKLRVELVKKGWTQVDLARVLGLRPSTFSGWARGVYPAPGDLTARIEGALGLESGTLAKDDPSDHVVAPSGESR